MMPTTVSEERMGSVKELFQKSETNNISKVTNADELFAGLEKIKNVLLKNTEILEIKMFISEENNRNEKTSIEAKNSSLIQLVENINKIVERHDRAQKMILDLVDELEKELKCQKTVFDELQMERDVLLERVHAYLKVNSSLKSRLEEQRCRSLSPKKQSVPSSESAVDIPKFSFQKFLHSESLINKEKETEMVVALSPRTPRQILAEIDGRDKFAGDILTRKSSAFCGQLSEIVDKDYNIVDYINHYPDLHSKDDSNLQLYFENKNSVSALKSKKSLPKRLGQKLVKSSPPREDLLEEEDLNKNKESESANPQPLQAQLNALTNGLANVSLKLKVLKQVTNCESDDSFQEEDVLRFSRNPKNLKRKAESLDADSAEEPIQEFDKKISETLKEAQKLNMKLQNLKDEKQKFGDIGTKEANADEDEEEEEEEEEDEEDEEEEEEEKL